MKLEILLIAIGFKNLMKNVGKLIHLHAKSLTNKNLAQLTN